MLDIATHPALVHAQIIATSWLDQLLGLTRLSTSNENAQLGWRSPLPVWVWLFIILGAFVLAGWSYSRLIGSRPKRLVLSCLRALLIIVIVALLAGPMLVVKDEIRNPDWLLVLVDRSASLNIRDVVAAKDELPITRDASLRQALAKYQGVFSSDQLGKDRRIVWLAFDGVTSEIDAPTDSSSSKTGGETEIKKDKTDRDNSADAHEIDLSNQQVPLRNTQVTLPDAVGQSTAIRLAIEQALHRGAGQPISGIVLFTDGRSPQTIGADTIARLKQQRIGVYPVPLGAEKTPLNIAVARVDAPQRAFIEDRVPVMVTIDKQPSDIQIDESLLLVKLIDQQTGKVLDQKRVTQGLDKPIALSTRSTLRGRQTWRVQVDYDPPTGASIDQRELVTDDNHQNISVEFIDDPIRVLYVEGYPRWEYRYLKTMLTREKSLDSSMMLISADRAFAQEGNTPLTRMPSDAKELEPFDVIIIGDVPSSYFGAELLSLMRDHVSTRGAGLIWIGGQHFTPSSYGSTPLADLLPMQTATVASRIDPGLGPIAMLPTPQAKRLNVLQLRSDLSRAVAPSTSGPNAQPNEQANTQTGGITWPKLPPFNWAQDVGTLKPAVEVLAFGKQARSKPFPLVSRMPFGAGQTIYLATDETWRWRYGRGELYFQQYWVQLIRLLRQQIQQRNDSVYLEVPSRNVQLGQAVKLTLHVQDPLILQRNLSRITLTASKANDSNGRVLDRIDLVATKDSSNNSQRGNPSTSNLGRAGRTYTAIWQTSVAGDLLLRVAEAGLDDLGLEEAITVIHPNDERRQPATDHARLSELAKATGGSVVPLTELEQLPGLIPSRAQRTENDTTEPLWHSPLALIIVVLLITLEWVGRKWIRLV